MIDESDFLLEARDYIADHGWTQNKSIDESTGAACLSGSLMQVTLRHSDNGEDVSGAHGRAEGALRRYCLDEYLITHTDAWSVATAWVNDHLVKSKEEACEILEQASKRAKED